MLQVLQVPGVCKFQVFNDVLLWQLEPRSSVIPRERLRVFLPPICSHSRLWLLPTAQGGWKNVRWCRLGSFPLISFLFLFVSNRSSSWQFVFKCGDGIREFWECWLGRLSSSWPLCHTLVLFVNTGSAVGVVRTFRFLLSSCFTELFQSMHHQRYSLGRSHYGSFASRGTFSFLLTKLCLLFMELDSHSEDIVWVPDWAKGFQRGDKSPREHRKPLILDFLFSGLTKIRFRTARLSRIFFDLLAPGDDLLTFILLHQLQLLFDVPVTCFCSLGSCRLNRL